MNDPKEICVISQNSIKILKKKKKKVYRKFYNKLLNRLKQFKTKLQNNLNLKTNN